MSKFGALLQLVNYLSNLMFSGLLFSIKYNKGRTYSLLEKIQKTIPYAHASE